MARTDRPPSVPRTAARRRTLLCGAAAVAVVLAGCASGGAPAGRPAAAGGSIVAAAGTPAPVASARIDPGAALRCTDQLLADHGVRDLTIGVEPVADTSAAADGGTRDLLLTALSGLGPRSRALRVRATDPPARSAIGVVPSSGAIVVPPPTAGALAESPEFVLRASVRAPSGMAAEAAYELDLALLRLADRSQVAGTGARNSARVDGAGVVEADLQRLGVQLRVERGNGTARSQAMQALATLSALELVGRLARVPYWTCLGVPAEHPAVAAETQDWYDAMAGRPAELIAYMQRQLQRRQAYDGPVDGSVGPALKDAVARQRAALGLTPEPKLSLDFFRALLAAGPGAAPPRVASAAATPAATAAPGVIPAPAAAPEASGALGLRIDTGRAGARYVGGEPVRLVVTPSRDAHVYCYHRDENRQVVRFFPNRFQRDSRVGAAGGLVLPGAMRFQIVMNRRQAAEQIACFATERDVLARLPPALAAGDFAPLPADAMDRLRTAFADAASGSAVAQQSIELQPR